MPLERRDVTIEDESPFALRALPMGPGLRLSELASHIWCAQRRGCHSGRSSRATIRSSVASAL